MEPSNGVANWETTKICPCTSSCAKQFCANDQSCAHQNTHLGEATKNFGIFNELRGLGIFAFRDYQWFSISVALGASVLPQTSIWVSCKHPVPSKTTMVLQPKPSSMAKGATLEILHRMWFGSLSQSLRSLWESTAKAVGW